LSDDQRLELLGRVREEWVKGQVRQYERGYERQLRAAARLRRCGIGLVTLGWFILVGLLTSPWCAPAPEQRPAPPGPQPTATTADAERPGQVSSGAELVVRAPLSPAYPRNDILILASSLVIAGGLIIAYGERRSYKQLANQYERMAELFLDGD